MKTTEEELITIIKGIKEIKYAITKEMSLTNDLFFDSLDINMLFDALTIKFSFQIELEEAEKIKTVGDILELLERKRTLNPVYDEKH